MPKVTAAIAALLLVVVLAGCGEEVTPAGSENDTATQRSQSIEETPEEPDAELTVEDEGYLAEVADRTPPATVLDQFSDEELIALGHEGCAQIGDGTPIEDLRLVKGEEPNEWGYFLDTSAVFNSALLNYCPELIEEVP